MVAVRAVSIRDKTETVLGEDTLELEPAGEYVVCGAIVVSYKQLECIRVRPVVGIWSVVGPPTAVCPGTSVVVLWWSVLSPAKTTVSKRSGEWVIYID